MKLSLEGQISQKIKAVLLMSAAAVMVIAAGQFRSPADTQNQPEGIKQAESVPVEKEINTEYLVGLVRNLEVKDAEEVTAVTAETAGIEPVERVMAASSPAPAVSEYSNKVLANVSEALNIRVTPSQDAEIIGKMYRGAAGELLEQSDGWTKIRSGAVEGWVSNDFLVFGEAIEAKAIEMGIYKAAVNTETLRVRAEAHPEAAVLGLASHGDKYSILEDHGEWLKIRYTDSSEGFIKAEYVNASVELGKALTMEEEQALKKVAEAKEASTKVKSAASQDEVHLLAACVMMEAGSSYEGQLAVANVVLNRVRSGRWGNSITSVIYASGQFPGASNGKLDRILAKGPSQTALRAVNDAMSGVNNVGDYLFFNSASWVNTDNYSQYVIIGGNCFYKK